MTKHASHRSFRLTPSPDSLLTWLRVCITGPFRALYGKRQISFDSQFSVADSTQKLRDRINPRKYSLYNDSFFAGSVTSERVTLHRPHPYEGRNSFIPVFYGRLSESDGKATLSGSITIRPGAKIFSTIFILTPAFALLLPIVRQGWQFQGSVSDVFISSAPRILAAFLVWLFFSFVIRRGSEHSSEDKQWLATMISRTLTPDQHPHTVEANETVGTQETEMVSNKFAGN